MGGGKRIALAIALLAIVAGAIAFIVKNLQVRSPRPPDSVLKQKAEMIDEKTLDLVTLTVGEWEKLGCKDGRYKNPNTGKRTMVPFMLCASCGQKIPCLVSPNKLDRAAIGEMRSYKCPKCGGRAYNLPG